MLLDIEEAEGNVERLAHEIKDQDYDFLEVLDENEEIENMYEELMQEHQRFGLIIEEQKYLLEQQEAEKNDLKLSIEEREKALQEKDQLITELQ